MSATMPLTATYHLIEYADITASALHEAVDLLAEAQEEPTKVEPLVAILRALAASINRDIHQAKEQLGAEALKELEMHRPNNGQTVDWEAMQ
jgi:hypothetical protein